MPEKFLVRFRALYFFVGCVGDKPTAVLVPSLAAVMNYDSAFEIAKRLQRLGYDDAVVATTRGIPAIGKDLLESATQATEGEVSQLWL